LTKTKQPKPPKEVKPKRAYRKVDRSTPAEPVAPVAPVAPAKKKYATPKVSELMKEKSKQDSRKTRVMKEVLQHEYEKREKANREQMGMEDVNVAWKYDPRVEDLEHIITVAKSAKDLNPAITLIKKLVVPSTYNKIEPNSRAMLDRLIEVYAKKKLAFVEHDRQAVKNAEMMKEASDRAKVRRLLGENMKNRRGPALPTVSPAQRQLLDEFGKSYELIRQARDRKGLHAEDMTREEKTRRRKIQKRREVGEMVAKLGRGPFHSRVAIADDISELSDESVSDNEEPGVAFEDLTYEEQTPILQAIIDRRVGRQKMYLKYAELELERLRPPPTGAFNWPLPPSRP
jgi:uncharacterized protein (DUF305 family)